MIRWLKQLNFGVISAVILLTLHVSVSHSAQAKLTKSQVKQGVENKYDVKVLDITLGESNGVAAFIVKVMYNGGNWNTAFQVNTIVIDTETGKRIRQFGHNPSGRTLAKNRDAVPNRQTPNALRGHIWR
ncbi:MAG: hypothetical protein VX617_02010 [Pseudomonadota bacterium]|nr:hypothetical protein [Pseudomonadota bacterium]